MTVAAPAEQTTIISSEQWQQLSEFDQIGVRRLPGVQYDPAGNVVIDLSPLTIHQLYKLADIVNRLER